MIPFPQKEIPTEWGVGDYGQPSLSVPKDIAFDRENGRRAIVAVVSYDKSPAAAHKIAGFLEIVVNYPSYAAYGANRSVFCGVCQ